MSATLRAAGGSVPDIAMLCPTRNRPFAVEQMGRAWERTGGNVGADLIWIIDCDDPEAAEYARQIDRFPWMKAKWMPLWQPMVPKLNEAAVEIAADYPAVGFIGDDHLPRTLGWPRGVAAALAWRGISILYGKDGFQDDRLPTWWVMSGSIVEALARMVPAPVAHLYCDNAIKVLGEQAGCLHYLPSIMFEHMHPVAGKGKLDEGYARVNRREQYERDLAQFMHWMEAQRAADVTIVRELRGV